MGRVVTFVTGASHRAHRSDPLSQGRARVAGALLSFIIVTTLRPPSGGGWGGEDTGLRGATECRPTARDLLASLSPVGFFSRAAALSVLTAWRPGCYRSHFLWK